ncbi:Hypothetical predicted protein [Xyrichtys novacula]|uniref:Uncharacterized protein n=1 Tax=Xyrichtys novacula TaxID=13765 RepID=A0AAV1FML9_XYRNO|nr:Hypothetical predicted protein [Xyrichtys novacula]
MAAHDVILMTVSYDIYRTSPQGLIISGVLGIGECPVDAPSSDHRQHASKGFLTYSRFL